MTIDLDSLFDGDPAFERRCFMLDVSRDRVPTLETLDWLISLLAKLRFNELQLYIEHTYQYRGHDVVWQDAGAYSADDIAHVRGSAAAAGVKLVANMNGFGHMGRWLRHDEYRELAECPDGAPNLVGTGTMPPGCLAPTPESADLAVSLAREMLDVVGGDTVMIGGDEPFELGRGRSADRCQEVGVGAVYREHLGCIMQPLLDDGHEVLFWGDQFRVDPAAVDWIPDGATCVAWNYEAPADGSGLYSILPDELKATLGLPADAHTGCAAHIRLLAEAGRPFWVAAGTSSWNTLIGRTTNASANIADTALVGAANGAQGFMLTDWGDGGHHHPLVVSVPQIVRGGVAAWVGRGVDLDVGPIIDQLLGARPGTGAMIDELGHLGERLGVVTPNGSPICEAMIKMPFPTIGKPDPAAVDAAFNALQTARQMLNGAFPDTSRGSILDAEIQAVTALATLGLRRLAGDDPTSEEIEAAIEGHRTAWLQSSRAAGLEDSVRAIRTTA